MFKLKDGVFWTGYIDWNLRIFHGYTTPLATVGFKELEESVKEAGFELVGDGKYVQFIPGEAELEKLAVDVALLKDKLLA